MLVVAEIRMMTSCSGHWKGIFSFGSIIIFLLFFPHFCVLKTHFKMQLFLYKRSKRSFCENACVFVSTSSEYWRQANNIPWMMVKK